MRLVINIITYFVITLLLIIYRDSLSVIFADAPAIDHQEIKNIKQWEQISLPRQTEENLHDGRKIYFNTAKDLSQCNDKEFIKNFPDINGISYLSDGNILNTSFWLSKPPLKNEELQYLSNISKIDQISIRIDIEDLNKTWSLADALKYEIKSIKKEFSNVNVINQTTNDIQLDGNPAIKLVFNSSLQYSTLGNPHIIAMDIFTIINGKLYKILYVATPKEFYKNLSIINEMISSLKILDKDSTLHEEIRSSKINNTVNFINQTSYLEIDQYIPYSHKQIKIMYPSNWGKIEGNNHIVRFFSPIKGPFLIGNGYLISIDVPSVYNAPTDFVAKVIWVDSLFNRKWFKSIEEVSSIGNTRTLENTQDFSTFLKEQKSYEGHIPLSIDLQKINSPNQYLMVFSTELTYIKNGVLCELLQNTNQVSIPPPKFSIIPSLNSSTIGPGQSKTIEVKVKSFTEIPSRISLSTIQLESINATFSPSVIDIPPSGWTTTQLTIKSGWNKALKPYSTTETLPIIAKIGFTERGNVFTFGTNTLNSSSPEIPKPEVLGIAMTSFNLYDYILHILNLLNTPLNVFIALVGFFGAGIGWFIKKYTEKKQYKGK
jgi:hypothetical protein